MEEQGLSQHSTLIHDVKDLSQAQEPISNFISCYPVELSDWHPFKLTEDQIEVLDDRQVDILLKDLEEIANASHPAHNLWYEFNINESNDPDKVLFHSLGAWRITQAFHDLLWHPAVVKPLSQLLEDQPGNVAWHQDYSYWTRTKPLAHLTMHIALDDQTLENGCLHYIPESHLWPLLPITSRHFTDMESIKSVLTEEQLKQFHPQPMLLKRGEACIHHGHTVHGSYPNRSDHSRRATVINVFMDGVMSDSDEVLLNGVPSIPKGQKMQGRFFPLLFDPSDPCRYSQYVNNVNMPSNM